MKSSFVKLTMTAMPRLAILCGSLSILVAATLLSSAHSQTATIRIENNSSREIHHVFLSPTDQDNWGSDQLNDTVIRSGDSFTLNNVTCSGSDIKVIAEDQNGCFLSAVLGCGGDGVWTITSETPANCGGN